MEVLNLLHCSLLFPNAESRQFVPWLAETMPQVSRRDSLTRFTYRLRPQATWDNGQPVLARDVAFTLKVMNCPGLPTEYVRAQYGFVIDIELDPADTRRFTLVCRGSSPDILVASGDYAILPESALDPRGELRAIPLPLLRTDTAAAVRRYPALRALAQRYRQARLDRHPERLPGCGPYTLTAWRSGRQLQLLRKSRWWANQLPNAPTWLQARAQRLEYRVIPDDATAVLALRRGDLDLYSMPAARDFRRLQQSADTARLAFYTTDSYNMLMVGFNTQHPLLSVPATRRALSLLFDVPKLMQATQAGLAYRSVSLVNPQDRAVYNDSLPLLPYAPTQAAAALRQGGWQQRAGGEWWRGNQGPLTLSISYQAGQTEFETVALQFRAAAAQLGVSIRLRPTEAGLLQQQLVAGDVELYVRTLYSNPYSYNFAPILHSRSIGVSNFSRYRSAPADRLIDAISVEGDSTRRVRMLRQFQRLLRADSPLTVLYFTRNRLLASKRLRGVHVIGVRPGYSVLRLELNLAAR